MNIFLHGSEDKRQISHKIRHAIGKHNVLIFFRGCVVLRGGINCDCIGGMAAVGLWSTAAIPSTSAQTQNRNPKPKNFTLGNWVYGHLLIQKPIINLYMQRWTNHKYGARTFAVGQHM